MLIEFKVRNFLSFCEEQTLSLVASASDKSLPNSLIDAKLPGLAGLKYLKGAAVYGANAAGKSNLIKALSFLKLLVTDSATKFEVGKGIPVEHFKLDLASVTTDTSFEISFVTGAIRFLYSVTLNRDHIVEEYLVAYPKGLPQRWFHRTYSEAEQDYQWEFSTVLPKRYSNLTEATKANTLFLSTAAHWNHKKLSEVALWFSKHLIILGAERDPATIPTTISRLKDPDKREKILKLMSHADLGIVDIDIEEKTFELEELESQIPHSLYLSLKENPKEIRGERPIFKHQGILPEPVGLGVPHQSSGTIRLFELAGVWTDIMDSESTVVIDELESSLHPNLVRELLKLVFDPKLCTSDAQVIFTTHNALLLNSGLLRRDQIWFAEKSIAGATTLFPLTRFKPRKDVSTIARYLSGDYGAVPFIPTGFDLTDGE